MSRFLFWGSSAPKWDRDSRRNNLRRMVNAAWATIRSTKYDLNELEHRVSLLERRGKADDTRNRRAAQTEQRTDDNGRKESEEEVFARLYNMDNEFRR